MLKILTKGMEHCFLEINQENKNVLSYNLMDRRHHLLSHLMSCPVFSITLPMYRDVYKNSKKTGGVHINRTSRCNRLPVVRKEKQLVCRILSVCSLSYPAWNADAPYYIVCCLSGYFIFFHISYKGHDIRGKKLLNIECV